MTIHEKEGHLFAFLAMATRGIEAEASNAGKGIMCGSPKSELQSMGPRGFDRQYCLLCTLHNTLRRILKLNDP